MLPGGFFERVSTLSEGSGIGDLVFQALHLIISLSVLMRWAIFRMTKWSNDHMRCYNTFLISSLFSREENHQVF